MLRKFIVALVIVLAPIAVSAQCKGFVKKECMPKMKPFIHNGQLNVSTLAPGQTTKVELTFYSGQNYRVLVCADAKMGKLPFKLFDEESNLIYDSADEGNPDVKDFNVASTIKLFLEVSVPKEGSATGCVSVMIGFHDAPSVSNARGF